jgi:phosphoenolpyruvate synthase/pyruvate phosphate dikinase
MNSKDFILQRIESGPLFKHWERDYSIFFLSMLEASHSLANSNRLGENTMTLALFTHNKGVSSYYRLADDNIKFFRTVAEKIKKDKSIFDEILTRYNYLGEKIILANSEIDKSDNFSAEFIQSFVTYWGEFVAYQLFVHRMIDYLTDSSEEQMLGQKFAELRTKYEKLFGFFEKTFSTLCGKVALQKKFKDYASLKLLTSKEFVDFIESGELPGGMADRIEQTVISVIPKLELFTDQDARGISLAIKVNQEKVAADLNKDFIKGMVAFGAGKITGMVQVITDYNRLSELQEGIILVTPSTLPKHEPDYHRAKAIITDEGGRLSHVAIYCREFKKPGLVGTKIATKVLKDGDKVEVDLEKGIVKILK